jgi:hypothetical protein
MIFIIIDDGGEAAIYNFLFLPSDNKECYGGVTDNGCCCLFVQVDADGWLMVVGLNDIITKRTHKK